MAADKEQMALVPVADAMPELRAEQYARVCAWDAARLALADEYDRADGEYLRLIRDELQRLHGARTPLWKAYLRLRDIPYDTANDRILKAEGRPHRHVSDNGVSPLSIAPAFQSAPTAPASTFETEPVTAAWVEDAGAQGASDGGEPEPEPEAVTIPSKITYSVADWKALAPAARKSEIALGLEQKASLNKQDTTHIEWARWSWNPITGCLHNCPYCYARDIANRFYPQGFEPTFHPYRLGAPAHQTVPTNAKTELGFKNIFTCSMADLFGKWAPREWIQAVIDVARANPQWNFLFLTKFPTRLAEFEFPDNAWLGTTVDCQARVKPAERAFAKVRGGVKWLSVEPMLEPITFTSLTMFDWMVIGGASASSQTPAWIPPRRWVAELESAALNAGCMIYEKTNLGLNDASRLREYPGWSQPVQPLPAPLAYLPSIDKGEW